MKSKSELKWERERKQYGVRRSLYKPPKRISPGRVLMHNHVIFNGFRAWTANKPYPGFVLCPCGYAGLKHYAKRDHVKKQRDPKWRKAAGRYVRAQWKRLGLS